MSMKKRLNDWARWSNANSENIGFKPIWEAIERHAPEPSSDNHASLPASLDVLMSDTDAALIDRAVSRMMKSAPLLCGIIRKHYLRRNTDKEIAQFYLTPMQYPEQIGMDWADENKKRVSHKVVRQLIRQAHEVVELELELIQNEKYLAARNEKYRCQSPVTRKKQA